jgi:hypothetical protein
MHNYRKTTKQSKLNLDFKIGNLAIDLVAYTLDKGKLTIEKFVESYQGWRAHALQGDCAKLVAIWDSVVTDVCEEHNYKIHFKGNKVTLICLKDYLNKSN